MPRPLQRSRVLIGPGERVDLIVDFAAAPAPRRRAAQRRPRATDPTRSARRPTPGPLMQFRVGTRDRRPHLGPRRAAPAAGLGRRGARRGASTTWRMTDRRRLRPPLADQRPHLRSRRSSSARPKLGTVETWRLRNDTEGRPPDAPPPHRLVPARPQRPPAGAARGLPEGDLLHGPRRGAPDRRALQRLRRAST